MRSNRLLPEPDGPEIAAQVPSASFNETGLTMTLLRPRMSSTVLFLE